MRRACGRTSGRRSGRWWWTDDDGAVNLAIRYGSVTLKLKGDKTTIMLKTKADAVNVLTQLRTDASAESHRTRESAAADFSNLRTEITRNIAELSQLLQTGLNGFRSDNKASDETLRSAVQRNLEIGHRHLSGYEDHISADDIGDVTRHRRGRGGKGDVQFFQACVYLAGHGYSFRDTPSYRAAARHAIESR